MLARIILGLLTWKLLKDVQSLRFVMMHGQFKVSLHIAWGRRPRGTSVELQLQDARK